MTLGIDCRHAYDEVETDRLALDQESLEAKYQLDEESSRSQHSTVASLLLGGKSQVRWGKELNNWQCSGERRLTRVRFRSTSTPLPEITSQIFPDENTI
jgi:hypothetical protein